MSIIAVPSLASAASRRMLLPLRTQVFWPHMVGLVTPALAASQGDDEGAVCIGCDQRDENASLSIPPAAIAVSICLFMLLALMTALLSSPRAWTMIFNLFAPIAKWLNCFWPNRFASVAPSEEDRETDRRKAEIVDEAAARIDLLYADERQEAAVSAVSKAEPAAASAAPVQMAALGDTTQGLLQQAGEAALSDAPPPADDCSQRAPTPSPPPSSDGEDLTLDMAGGGAVDVSAAGTPADVEIARDSSMKLRRPHSLPALRAPPRLRADLLHPYLLDRSSEELPDLPAHRLRAGSGYVGSPQVETSAAPADGLALVDGSTVMLWKGSSRTGSDAQKSDR